MCGIASAWKRSSLPPSLKSDAPPAIIAVPAILLGALLAANAYRAAPLIENYFVSTTIVPVICGCKAQKYGNVPGVANVNENVSSVSIAFDRNAMVFDVTVCGMSSWLTQVTVSPAFTVICCGLKVKLSIFTSMSAARAGLAAAIAAATRSAIAPSARNFVRVMGRSALQRRVDDGEPLLALLEGHAGGAEHAAQFVVRNFHRAGRRRGAGRRLREGGRARGVERHIALHLLHHLVDVAVEHGHRAETFQGGERLRAVLGAPAPLRVQRPQRDMCEHDDRRRGRFAFQIVLDPFDLLFAEAAHTAALEIGDVDEPHEMHAVGVERVIARPFGAAAVTFLVELDVGIDDVVLARHVMH